MLLFSSFYFVVVVFFFSFLLPHLYKERWSPHQDSLPPGNPSPTLRKSFGLITKLSSTSLRIFIFRFGVKVFFNIGCACLSLPSCALGWMPTLLAPNVAMQGLSVPSHPPLSTAVDHLCQRKRTVDNSAS